MDGRSQHRGALLLFHLRRPPRSRPASLGADGCRMPGLGQRESNQATHSAHAELYPAASEQRYSRVVGMHVEFLARLPFRAGSPETSIQYAPTMPGYPSIHVREPRCPHPIYPARPADRYERAVRSPHRRAPRSDSRPASRPPGTTSRNGPSPTETRGCCRRSGTAAGSVTKSAALGPQSRRVQQSSGVARRTLSPYRSDQNTGESYRLRAAAAKTFCCTANTVERLRGLSSQTFCDRIPGTPLG
jgi:hypothetical protein